MISEMDINNNILFQTLIRGRNSTTKLQTLLNNNNNNIDGSVSAGDLLTEILESFSSGISMLSSSVSGEKRGFPASSLGSPVEKVPEKKPPVKERRGCYKRRKTIDSSEIISATIEDAFAWRKYGQKEILNSKSPRCYFRCTHKNTYGCKAQKQVQKLEEESNMYHITYLGKHTCPTFTNHQLVLNFQDSKNNIHVPNSPSTITTVHTDPSVKQEVESKDQSTDVSDIVSSANDENSSPFPRWNFGASYMKFDYEDSCASTSSHGYMYMDDLNHDDWNDSLLDQVFS